MKNLHLVILLILSFGVSSAQISQFPLINFVRIDHIFSDQILAPDHFGHEAILSGSYLYASAPYATNWPHLAPQGLACYGCGFFSRYDKINTNWVYNTKRRGYGNTHGTNSLNSQHLGWSMDIWQNLMVVGMPNYNNSISRSGEVHLTTLVVNNAFNGLHIIDANDAQSYDRFGESVSISGPIIAIGANKKDIGNIQDVGKIYIYDNNLSQHLYPEFQTINSPSMTQGNQFGSEIEIDDQTKDIIVYSSQSQGTVYIFSRATTYPFEWSLSQTITNPISGFYFGNSLKSFDDGLMIGCQSCIINGVNSSGAVFWYKRNSTTGLYNLEQTIAPTNISSFMKFGNSIDISDELMIVGAYGENNDRGSAFLFQKQNGQWVELNKFLAYDGNDGDQFGFSVALDGENLAIGANEDEVNGEIQTGSIHMYEKCRSNSASIISQPSNKYCSYNATIEFSVDSRYPVEYTWYNHKNMVVGNTSIVNLPRGSYYCNADNGCVILQSNTVRITSEPPANGICNEGKVGDFENTLEIYPNPAQSEVNIIGQDLQTIRMYDHLGKELFPQINRTDNKAIINLKSIPSGIYYLKVDSKSGTERTKILIEN